MGSSAYPRVSTILRAAGLAPSFDGVPARTLEAARERGTAGHELIAAHHYGYLEPGQSAPPAYLAFLEESSWRPEASEFEVVSERWRFCGHPDQRGWMQGRRGLLDWKFTDSLERAPVQRQLAAYRLAWNEMHPDQPIAFCAAVQLLSTGRPKFDEFTKDEMAKAENEFLASVVCFHARGRTA